MDFYAKSTLDKIQLDCKMNIGCDGIEIQLMNELINEGTNHGINSYFSAEEVFNLDDYLEYPIKVIHVPSIGLALESLIDSDFKLLDQVFYIANYFGSKKDSKVIVVIRSDSEMHHLRTLNDTWKRILNGVGCLLLKYPYTELAIENVPPFEIAGDRLYLTNNFGYSNAEMAIELRRQLKTDRIGTVLDTCNAMMTNMYMMALSKMIVVDSFIMESYDMDSFFAKNENVLKLIHLSNVKDDGFLKNHGVGFSNLIDSQMTLVKVLDLYKGFCYDCPITIEVFEEDYSVSENYKMTLATIKDILEMF